MTTAVMAVTAAVVVRAAAAVPTGVLAATSA